MSAPVTLPIREVEKVWGRTGLPAPFAAAASEARIGEIWFEPQAPCDGLLAKYLFTSEKLSVQVHPDDAQAPEGSRGKEECWLVLDAEPDARLAIGFRHNVMPEQIRAAALDGSIEQLLDWHRARRGDFFYLPAGTVHAIGPGLSLVEIQQNSDITYRLYDYGRPRELHLDAAMDVAQGTRYDGRWHQRVDFTTNIALVRGPHFTLDLVTDGAAFRPRHARLPMMILPLAGDVHADGEVIEQGGCAIVAPGAALDVAPGGCVLVASDLSPAA